MMNKILIVEDDKTESEAISFALKNEGYETQIAQDGWEAVEFIENEKIDLVISDLMMPNISGLTLLDTLSNYYHNRIPVIVISSLDRENVIVSALGMGAHDFMVKPVDYKNLVERVKALIAERKPAQKKEVD